MRSRVWMESGDEEESEDEETRGEGRRGARTIMATGRARSPKKGADVMDGRDGVLT